MSAALEGWAPRTRPMTEADLDAVWEIEKRAYLYPWSRGIFVDCLRVPYSCEILEQGGRILGYGILSLAAGEAHLLNLCLEQRVQGRGLGTRMLEHMTAIARAQRAGVIYLEVRPSNARAIALYHRAGFQQIGTRPNYYRDGAGREDALVFARTI
jgi:[ribosomal protein S18]-alanine N-acetyltransferase